jgi:hypothetical protein
MLITNRIEILRLIVAGIRQRGAPRLAEELGSDGVCEESKK